MRSSEAIGVEVTIATDGIELKADVNLPTEATGLVIFAHGSGSSRHSPRNRYIARALRDAGLGTLLVDLLTPEEDEQQRWSQHLRFDVALLARRLNGCASWVKRMAATRPLSLGYFGASTGAAAALIAAAAHPRGVNAIVSRGGRPDLAGPALPHVKAPTLLIVGSQDRAVLDLNQNALEAMNAPAEMRLIPGASHLFPEPGALEQVSQKTVEWFARFLNAPQLEVVEPPLEAHA